MGKEPEDNRDYRRCPDGQLHDWQYDSQREYVCKRCGFQATKKQMKEALD